MIGAVLARADLAALRELVRTVWSKMDGGAQARALDRFEAAKHLVLDYAEVLEVAAAAVPAAPVAPKVNARIAHLHALLEELAQTADPARVAPLRTLVTAQLARHNRLSLDAGAAIRMLSTKPEELADTLAAVSERERFAHSDLGLLAMHLDNQLAPLNSGTNAIVDYVRVELAKGVDAPHGGARALKALVFGNPSAVAALNQQLPAAYRCDGVEVTEEKGMAVGRFASA